MAPTGSELHGSSRDLRSASVPIVAAGVTDPLANIYTGDSLSDDVPAWLLFIPAFQVAIPLTVAYAVVRHRAFDAGLIANRTLVYGVFLCGGFAAFALLDVLVTKRFANNQFEVGLDIALALAIGRDPSVRSPSRHTLDRPHLLAGTLSGRCQAR